MQVVAKDIDLKAMKRIPKTMINKLNLIISRNEKNELLVFTDKITTDKKVYINFIFSGDIKFEKMDKNNILQLLKIYNESKDDSILNENSIQEELENILLSAVKRGCSDIHMEPQVYYTVIRFRINGELFFFNKLENNQYLSIVNRIKVLGSMDIANRIEPQDGKMFISKETERIDIRISSIPTTNGEKLVLRILYKDESLNKISNLNFSEFQLKKISKLLKLKKGMIIINGPTGSGKSTTLYALLNEFDKDKYNISTIEDPVEVEIPLITQSNINEKIGFGFAQALKYILRQDPDVILVGEIRDEETAKMAVRSAITGHKVLTTVHTSFGNEVKSRLLNMGVDSYLLEDCLSGVITQRLIKILCSNCKIRCLKEFDGAERVLYIANGCEKCSNTGYEGRTVVAEVVDFTNCKNIEWGQELLLSVKKLALEGKITIDDYNLFKDGEGLSDIV
ncbi:MAG: GspE/PulE family protein [Sarcina sp.]